MRWLHANHHAIVKPYPNWVKLAKRLGEITTLAHTLRKGGLGRLDPMLDQHAREWLHGAWLIVGKGEIFATAVAGNPAWVSLSMNYLPFYLEGLRNERFEELLRTAAARPPELEWFVALAVACALERMAIPSPLDVLGLARQSWCMRINIYKRPDPARAYETTHVVMWLAELGIIPTAVRESIAAWNPLWIESYQAVHNPDVVAELVAMQHAVDGCVSAPIWQWLLDKQDPDGSFPELDAPNRALGRYHATVVAALTLAICLGSVACHHPESTKANDDG